MTTMEAEFNATEAKLLSVKAAIRKAMDEAMKSASSQDALELPFKPLNTESLENSTELDFKASNMSSSESFALGMTLFGQDISVIEKSIQEKLTLVDAELTEVIHALKTEKDDGFPESPEHLEAEVESLKTRIEFLQICSKARASLDEATTLSTASTTSEPDFLAAAAFLITAKAELSEAEAIVHSEESRSDAPSHALLGAYRIIESIRTAIRKKCLDLTSKASSLLETSVEITPSSISVKGSSSNGLSAAFDIIEKLSPSSQTTIHNSLRDLTDELVVKAIRPVLNDWKNGVCSSWKFSESASRHLVSLEWSREEESVPTDCVVAMRNPFIFLQRVLRFFQAKVLIDRSDLSQRLGELLFEAPTDSFTKSMKAVGIESNLLHVHPCSIISTILDSLSDTCIPIKLSSQGLSSLKEIATNMKVIVDSFDAEMRQIKLYPDSTKSSPLSKFVETISQKYVEKRRATILNEARDILQNKDYHNTVEVGEEIKKQPSLIGDGSYEVDVMSVFRLHKCAVSQTAKSVLDLTRRTMDEATDPFPAEDEGLALLPPNLYRTARQILDMFRAVIPTIYEHDVANVPRIAAVLHNDCVFFAHHCLTLGLEYKERFPNVSESGDLRGVTLRQMCMFVDMVPLFRELADQAMGDMLENQHGQILEIVGSRLTLFGASLKSNESVSEWVDAETAMKAGMYHVTTLAKIWRPVLSMDVHKRSVGFLLDAIFNIFLDQLFLAVDISESASHLVSSIFRLGMHGALEVTGNDVSACSSWDRFLAVGRFMDMSLADISVALSDGVFRAITGQELSKLITATFDDSKKRQLLLHALASES